MKRDLIREKLVSERQRWIEAPMPLCRDDLNVMSQGLMKLFIEMQAFQMTVEVSPPNADSEIGSYAVNLVHPKGKVRGSGIHLWDAIYMARAAVYELDNAIELVATEVEVSSEPVKRVSAKEIDFL